MEVIYNNYCRDKLGFKDELSIILVEFVEEEIDIESFGLIGERVWVFWIGGYVK